MYDDDVTRTFSGSVQMDGKVSRNISTLLKAMTIVSQLCFLNLFMTIANMY